MLINLIKSFTRLNHTCLLKHNVQEENPISSDIVTHQFS